MSESQDFHLCNSDINLVLEFSFESRYVYLLKLGVLISLKLSNDWAHFFNPSSVSVNINAALLPTYITWSFFLETIALSVKHS